MDSIWLAIGLLGQACFTSRFLIQWIASERQKKSVVPALFWYCSIVGGGLLLAYALYRKDPVFICGQLAGLVVYARNLMFITKERRTCALS